MSYRTCRNANRLIVCWVASASLAALLPFSNARAAKGFRAAAYETMFKVVKTLALHGVRPDQHTAAVALVEGLALGLPTRPVLDLSQATSWLEGGLLHTEVPLEGSGFVHLACVDAQGADNRVLTPRVVAVRTSRPEGKRLTAQWSSPAWDEANHNLRDLGQALGRFLFQPTLSQHLQVNTFNLERAGGLDGTGFLARVGMQDTRDRRTPLPGFRFRFQGIQDPQSLQIHLTDAWGDGHAPITAGYEPLNDPRPINLED